MGCLHLLPKAIILIFKLLAKALQGEGRLVSVSRHVTTPKELFRTDARAEGEEIWIGGWALDYADTRRCRWFSERLQCAVALRGWRGLPPDRGQQSLSLAFQRLPLLCCDGQPRQQPSRGTLANYEVSIERFLNGTCRSTSMQGS